MGERAYLDFRWREHGCGEAVVLLHGLVGHTDHWEPALRGLGQV